MAEVEIEEFETRESDPLLDRVGQGLEDLKENIAQRFPSGLGQGGTVSIADLKDRTLRIDGDDGEGWGLEELREKLRDWKNNYRERLRLSPFINRTPDVSIYQIFKFIILLPIAILRMLIFVISLLLCWVVSAVAIRGLEFPKDSVEVEPLSMDRRSWAEKISIWNRWMMFACGFWRFDRTGKRDPSVGTLVANHVSFFDPFIINCDLAVAPLNKKELAHIPMAGTILRGIQAILVDRTSKESRKATATIMKKRSQENQENPGTWPPTLVFPEGTCTNGDIVMGFRPGAFLAGEPVQPVVLKYPWTYNDNAFTPYISLPRIILFSMFQFYNRIEMKYLPIYYPSDEEQQDPALYAKNLQKVIANELQVPATTHSFYDMNLAEKGWCKKKFPQSSLRFEFEYIKEGLPKLTSKVADKYFAQFCEIDKKRKGKISQEAILEYYSLPSSPAFDNLFTLISGTVSDNELLVFVEYVLLMYGLEHLGSESADHELFHQLGAGEEGLTEDKFLAFMGAQGWSQPKSKVLFEQMSKSQHVASFVNFREFLENDHALHRFLFLSHLPQ